MKKTLLSVFAGAALVAGLSAPLFAGGNQNASGKKVLTVGATAVPHAELLNLVKDDLAAHGIELKVVEFTDYITPNEALLAGDLDANFFQHLPYLETNLKWRGGLVSAFAVHVEPLGLYSASIKHISALKDGASIAIPNDPTNGGRALLLLQTNGLITVDASAGLTPTPLNITSNPRNFKFRELEAAQMPRVLGDVDAAAINGNYALQAGFNPVQDSLVIEGAESPYVNIVAVKKGTEKEAWVHTLERALKSQKVKNYINTHYEGGVVAAF
jgi:D-methionine transport system substrate-binding protein